MIILPIFCSIISLACAIVMGRDAKRRPRPDKVVWALAFLMFALAAGTDAAGRSLGWNEVLARLYYATGPALVVMYLAIGELYLLAPERMKRFGVGATALCTAFWVALVLNAPIDAARLADDGWEAIERNGFMVFVTVMINTIGTCIIVGGTIWSAWRFKRLGIMRNRMIGCVLIAIGTLAVATGGSLTRLGHYEYLYIAMSVGVAIIFAGVLWTRRPEAAMNQQVTPTASVASTDALGAAISLETDTPGGEGIAAMSAVVPTARRDDGIATALGFIEGRILVLDEAGIDRLCTEWSVPRDPRPVMERGEARAIWTFRSQLSGEAAMRFDALSVPARRQIAELHACVLAPGEVASMVRKPFEQRAMSPVTADLVRPTPVPFPVSAGLQPTMPPFAPDEDDDLHFPYA